MMAVIASHGPKSATEDERSDSVMHPDEGGLRLTLEQFLQVKIVKAHVFGREQNTGTADTRSVSF
jgi:hypothetical protein